MTDPKNPSVYIIILNWNGWVDTIECLKSLRCLTYPNFRIIIVDNGSTNNSIKKITSWASGYNNNDLNVATKNKQFNPLFWIEYNKMTAENGGNKDKEEILHEMVSNQYFILINNKENLGFAAGNNVAIRYALKQKAPMIMLLNNDTVVSPDFLTRLTKNLISNANWIAIGPKILFQNDPQRIWYAGARINLIRDSVTHIGFKQMDSLRWKGTMPTDHISACCILAYDTLFKKIGLLDEDYFFIHEDWDLSCRLKKSGLKVGVDLDAIIYHKVCGSIREGKGLMRNIYYSNKNRLLILKKNASWWEKLLGFSYYISSRFYKLILLGLQLKLSQVFTDIKSTYDFLSGHYGQFDRKNIPRYNIVETRTQRVN